MTHPLRDRKTDPEVPKSASTAILLRPCSDGFQVYLVQRSAQSDFMPGNYVFPGGTLDPEDRDPILLEEHLDLTPDETFRRLGDGVAPEVAVAHAVAAVRETFEEAGILLARNRDGSSVETASPVAGQKEPHKARRNFRDRVVKGGWVLEISRLFRWAHWVTPAVMPKRFDTRFFAALSPDGQECFPDLLATTRGVWIDAMDALDRNHEGEIALSPPTLVSLHELLAFRDLGALKSGLEKRPWGAPRTPRALRGPEGPVILLPWDPMYDREFRLGEAPEVLPPGAPFSRLWQREGIWRPVH
jgi:8-oxo-dGTP pyrophosphatase MutT (NUDIX family)